MNLGNLFISSWLTLGCLPFYLGTACPVQASDDKTLVTRPLLETPTSWPYAPPEVVRKSKNYDFSLDIWSAGVIFWEMLQDDARKSAVGAKGVSHIDAMDAFIQHVATVRQEMTPGAANFDLACQMLQVTPSSRPCAKVLLEHVLFAPLSLIHI